MKKIGKILLTIILSLISFCCVFALVQPILYRQYYQSAKLEFKVDGLMDGFIPQGLTYVMEADTWLYTGYMKDDQASRLYVVNDEGSRYIDLYTTEGMYEGHAGGIGYENDVVYLANGGSDDSNRIYMFSLQDVLNTENTKIVMEKYFHPHARASYCYVKDGMLWVGEFEDGGSYQPNEEHIVSYTNRAIVVGYELNENGLVDEQVDCVLSTGSRVQGMAIDDEGRIALSTSYGIASSHLKYYQSLDKQELHTFVIDQQEVPMYILDNYSCIFDIKAPQMAEGIVFKNGRLYVIYESCTLKYFFGILTKGKYIHSYDFY